MTIVKDDLLGFDQKDYDKIAEGLYNITVSNSDTVLKESNWGTGEIGRVYSVKDGIVRIKGLSDVVSNEKIRFSGVFMA